MRRLTSSSPAPSYGAAPSQVAHPLAGLMDFPYLTAFLPDQSTGFRLCLLRSLADEDDKHLWKVNLMQSYSSILLIILFFYLRRKLNACIHGLCPVGKRSCIGCYQRNLITIYDTTKLAFVWNLFPTLEVLLVLMFRKYPEIFSPKLALLINDGAWFALCSYYNIYFIYLLFTRDIPTMKETSQQTRFYVSKPAVLLPRDSLIVKKETKYFAKKSIYKRKTKRIVCKNLGQTLMSPSLTRVEEIERTLVY